MKKNAIKKGIYIADFETTVYDNQEDTKVWAASLVKMTDPDEPESVEIYGSIEAFMKRIFKGESKIVYFHNLKFDGSFIMNWLNENPKMELAGKHVEGGFTWFTKRPEEIFNDTYRYSISEKGMWYNITTKHAGCMVEFRDSLKLLPFSVKAIGSAFETKHKKLEMEYKGIRYPNCPRTEEEDRYIANDVLVVKEGLKWMFDHGHDKLTIGSCCMDEYKLAWYGQWNDFFPNLYEIPDASGSYSSIGDFIRESYHGGWCYVVPERACELINTELAPGIAGTTCDVNSLYPSMMHSDSGNYYPIGKPQYFKGKLPEGIEGNKDKYYFIRVKTHFQIKSGYLPTIQLKHRLGYPGREWLTSSDIQNRTGKETEYATVEMVLTMTDWSLLQKHYDLEETEVIDGYIFNAVKGIFDEYINKYAKIKRESKGAMRTLAKLFLNNLYGKFATSMDSSFKITKTDNEGTLKFESFTAYDKKPGYIPIGSAITSYARNFTITAAQLNYHPGSRGFIYADTDSIHCDLLPEEIVGAPEHPTAFNHWKYESNWDCGWFVGPKRYAEHHTFDDREQLDNPYWDLKCAGMGKRSKELFTASLDGREEGKNETEREFTRTKRDITDFRVGLKVPGTLKAKQIPGGTLLIESYFQMRPVNKWT